MTKKIKIWITDRSTGEIVARHQEIVTWSSCGDNIVENTRLDAFFRGFKRILMKYDSPLIQMEADLYSPPVPTTIF